jgi:hypothetical protein
MKTARRLPTGWKHASARAAACHPPGVQCPWAVCAGHRLAGGSQIIGYVSQTLLAMLDWKLDPQQAVSLPHYGNRNGDTELESDVAWHRTGQCIARMGHTVRKWR